MIFKEDRQITMVVTHYAVGAIYIAWFCSNGVSVCHKSELNAKRRDSSRVKTMGTIPPNAT